MLFPLRRAIALEERNFFKTLSSVILLREYPSLAKKGKGRFYKL
jgi:hypothetical protein